MSDAQNRAAALLREHRASIDRLDAILVYTLAERFKHTQSVGRLKARHALPPSDPTREGQQIERLDPAARDVLSSELTRTGDGRNGSVVTTRDRYPWADFVPPGFADLLIYQFHVGSFAGRGDQHGVQSMARYGREYLGHDPVAAFALEQQAAQFLHRRRQVGKRCTVAQRAGFARD